MMVGTPTFLAGYLQKSDPGDFATVRLLITGADKCPESLRAGVPRRATARCCSRATARPRRARSSR